MSLISKVVNKFSSLLIDNRKELIDCEISPKAKLYPPYGLAEACVGDYTYIAANCKICLTTIQKFCSIGPDFCSGWGIHPLYGISTSPMFYSTQKQNGRTFAISDTFEERKHIHIGNDVFIGRSVIVLDGVTIGDGAVIGAGAVVTEDIPPYAIATGSPIKIIKYRFTPEVIDQLLEIQWWNHDETVLQKIADHHHDVHAFLREMKKQ